MVTVTHEVKSDDVTYHIAADGRIGSVLAKGYPYERKLLEHMRDNLDPGSLVVDVGAHVGNHTVWLAKVAGMRVVSFEPSYEAYALLEANVGMNGLGGQVETHRVALGAGSGRGRWDPNVKGRVLYIDPIAQAQDPIQIASLDSFDLTDVAGMKIDVEGGEPEVLRGASEVLLWDRPQIWAEAPTKGARERISSVLLSYNYELADVIAVATPLGYWRAK